MEDELLEIITAMEKAGESQESIAEVVQTYNKDNSSDLKNPEEPKGVKTEVEENIGLDSKSVSVESNSLLDSRLPIKKIDLKRRLEDKVLSKKDNIQPLNIKNRSLDEIKKNNNILKTHVKKERGEYLDNLPDRGLSYVNKASKKLQKEYSDAYEDAPNVDWKITEDQITREAINLRKSDLDDELYENTDMVEQAKLKFKSGGLRALSGIAGIPNFLNKTLFTLMASNEDLEEMNKLTPKQREVVLNSLQIGSPMGMLPMLSSQSQNYLKNKGKEVEKNIVHFHNSIGEDFSNFNFGKAFSRIGTEGVQQIPMLAQTMIPYVGLASVAAGEISNKQEELEDEGYGLGLDTTLNSTINGLVIAASEAFTKKLGGQVFKAFGSVDNIGRETMLKSMRKMFIDGSKEGLTEVGEETLTKLSDALIQGKEGQFDNYWKEMMDVYIIGKAVGSTLSGTSGIIRQTKNLIEEHKTNKLISSKDNNYTDLSDIFKGVNNIDRVNISNLNSTNIRLDKVLKYKVEKGDITQKESDNIKTNFLETKEALTKVNKVKLSDDSKVKVTNLLIKKKKLIEEMKNTDDSFHPTYKEKIEKINEQIRKEASIKEVEPSKDSNKAKTETKKGKIKTENKEKVVYTTDEINEVVDAKSFSNAQNTAINNRTDDKLQVTPMTEKDAQQIIDDGGKLYMTSDGKSGAYVKKDGYMGGLFKDPTANRSQAAKVLQEVRIKAGGKFFDAFGTHLEDIYIKNGFRPVVRMTFNEEYAPEGWKETNLKDKPDNVFFVYDPTYKAKKGEGQRIENIESNPDLQYQASYDIAKNYKVDESNKKGSDVQKEGRKTIKTGTNKSVDENVRNQYKKTADEIRKLKINKSAVNALSKLQSNPVGGVIQAVWDGAIETIATSIELTGDVNLAVNKGIEYLKNSEWYKGLSKKSQEKAIEELINNGFSEYQTNLTPEQAYKKSKSIADNARKQQSGDKESSSEKINKLLSSTIDGTYDRQGSVKKAISKIGMNKVVDYMVTKAGASSYAKNIVEEVYGKTFKGLSDEDIKNLEEIIQHLRTISISKNRTLRGLEQVKRQGRVTLAEAEIALEGYKKVLGEKKYDDLIKRAKEYFNEYKSLLKTMLDEGLINQDFYDNFAEVDYKPTEYLDFLEDMDGNFLDSESDKNSDIPLSGKQIKTMTKGYEGNESMDAWGILQKSILTRVKSVFNNRVNNVFIDEFIKTKNEIGQLKKKKNLTKEDKKRIKNFELVEKNIKLDSIVGFTKSNNPKYKLDGKRTKGYKSLYYYKDGVKHRVLLKEDFYEKFTDTMKPIISSGVKQNIALVSGTSFVKTLATGNNPLFFITNTPRDFFFALSFSEEYNNNVVYNSFRLVKDMFKGVKDVTTDSDNYKKYLEYGGGMDWLALQGKYRNKSWTKKIMDFMFQQKTQDFITNNNYKRFMDKFNLASEVGIRLAIFNKSIENQLDGKNIESLSKKEQDDIYTKAVHSARKLTDFNQGGNVAKAMDGAIPYLNAGIQGTRAAATAFKRDPVGTTWRITQITALSVGSMISASMGMIAAFREDDEEMTNSDIYFETIKGVSEYDLQNYFIVPLGVKDGNDNWKYLRMAKTHALTPFINISEHYIRKKLSETTSVGYTGDINNIMSKTIQDNIIPVDLSPVKMLSRVPLYNVGVAQLGYDAYTGNPLDWKKGEIPVELEGLNSDRIQPMYKKLGLTFGESPARLQKSIESFITTPSTNIYVGMAYGIGNMTTKLISGEDEKALYGDMKNDFIKQSFKRVVKSTSEYNVMDKLKKEVPKESFDILKKHYFLESKIRKDIRSVKSGDKSLSDVVNKYVNEYPEDKLRVKSWLKSEYKKTNKSYLTSSLKFMKNKELRALYLSEKFGTALLNINSLEGKQLEIVKELYKEKVLDKETMMYYKKLVSGK